MIRVDAYRLATIVDAYASCAKALQIRLILDPESIALPRRHQRMGQQLAGALEVLKDVKEQRNKHDSAKWKPMDPDVAGYVEEVEKKCNKIATHLKIMCRNA